MSPKQLRIDEESRARIASSAVDLSAIGVTVPRVVEINPLSPCRCGHLGLVHASLPGWTSLNANRSCRIQSCWCKRWRKRRLWHRVANWLAS